MASEEPHAQEPDTATEDRMAQSACKVLWLQTDPSVHTEQDHKRI